jgi:uncharacterized membrane protein YeaQ/YmgE (transglycosylase-associated protein family)
MLWFIIALVLVGLVAGFVARAVVPGPDPMTVGGTILLGIVGSFVGGFLADALFRSDTEDVGFGPVGIIGSTIGAILCLLVYRMATGRRGGLTRYR